MNEILFLITVFLTNIIQMITGFAGTMLAMPVSMILIGVDEAKAILNILGLLASIWIVLKNFRYVNKKEFLKITSIMLIGIFAGVEIFDSLRVDSLLKIYAVIIIAIALKSMLIKKKLKLPEYMMLIIVVLAGVIHGMFISGGSLLVIYAAKKFDDKSEFRATLSAVWIVLNLYLMILHINQGLMSTEVFKLTLYSVVPLFGGIAIGNVIHKKLNQQTFLNITYVLLLASGLLLLF